MENEVMNGTELEVVDDEVCEENCSGKKILACAGGAGLIAIAGFAAWRWVIRPIVNKIKAKRAARASENTDDAVETVED
jgi:hypothetical protein